LFYASEYGLILVLFSSSVLVVSGLFLVAGGVSWFLILLTPGMVFLLFFSGLGEALGFKVKKPLRGRSRVFGAVLSLELSQSFWFCLFCLSSFFFFPGRSVVGPPSKVWLVAVRFGCCFSELCFFFFLPRLALAFFPRTYLKPVFFFFGVFQWCPLCSTGGLFSSFFLSKFFSRFLLSLFSPRFIPP